MAAQLQTLRDHIRLAYTQAERDSADEFLSKGELILSSLNHTRKKPLAHCPSIQAMELDELIEDYSAREYHSCFIDAAGLRMCEIGQKLIHLTPELSAFLVRVLEKLLNWIAKDSNVIGFSFLSELGEELSDRKKGIDTFGLPTEPKCGRGRPRKVETLEYPDEQLFIRSPEGIADEDIAPDPDPVGGASIDVSPPIPPPASLPPTDGTSQQAIERFRRLRSDSHFDPNLGKTGNGTALAKDVQIYEAETTGEHDGN